LPSAGLAIEPDRHGADRLLAALRAGTPAVVARIEGGRVLIDLRTVEPGSDAALAEAIRAALASGAEGRPR
jgi:L-seryl-tRNA(Ser) seleniumtransferase